MPNWFCIKCKHEFPDEGVKRQPEYVGMVLFILVGVALLLFGVAGLYVGVTGRSLQVGVMSGMAVLFGVGTVRMGLQFGKGVKAICPACGRPQGVPADSKIADEVRKRGK